MKTNDSASIAATLAAQTASKAVELATAATSTATALATKTAETTAIINTNIDWMKQSLVGIQQTLKEMVGLYITKPVFDENQKMTDDHENRLRTIERNVQIWAGGLAILAFAVPILLKFFIN